jgi:N-acetylneuraminic acid mutarotase
MLQPRAGAAAASLINKLYVIGGGLEAAQEVTFSEVYDPVSETWQVVNTPMLADLPSWTNLGVANVESRIFVLGGNRGQTFSADTLVYAPFVYQTFIPAAAAGSNSP